MNFALERKGYLLLDYIRGEGIYWFGTLFYIGMWWDRGKGREENDNDSVIRKSKSLVGSMIYF